MLHLRALLINGSAAVCALLALGTAPLLPAEATSPPSASELYHYHFGDDARSVSLSFDDSGWTAEFGGWPLPVFDSDGFVWVRTRVPVPKDASEPLAVRLRMGGTHPATFEVFVNRHPVGIDGKELSIENGLPLGLSASSVYAESAHELSPSARLTLLTDGVVEAQSSTGELFGFDRTAAISTHSAEAIAAAAQLFDQEDDITVLTLTFAPAEVQHA